jgi:ABC-type Fe3+-hydroxamate transport system substrate-binding protein
MVALRDRYWRAVDFVNPYVPGPEVAFLEWLDPIFVGGHWTPQLIEAAGAAHSLNRPRMKSRQIAPEELLAAAPERIILCPCGFDVAATRRELPSLLVQRWWPLLPAVMSGIATRVVVVDGNQMFNRPGPRLVDAFEWLVGWINDRPEVIPPDFPVFPLAELLPR